MRGKGPVRICFASKLMSTDSNSDRRAWMKTALKAGAIGYAAPMIVGSVAKVSAATVSTPCSATFTNAGPCPASQPPFNCSVGNNSNCICVPEAGTGNTRCVQTVQSEPPSCTTTADCPGNWICVGACLACLPLCHNNVAV